MTRRRHHGRARVRLALHLALAVLCLATVPAGAEPVDVEAILRAVEEATDPGAGRRADGTIVMRTPEQTRRDRIVVLQRRTGELYVELRERGEKALLLADGRAFRLLKGAAQATDFPRDAAFADGDLTREDLEPFRRSRYTEARIVDEGPVQITLALAPTASQYSLVVTTIDRAKLVPIKTLYYQETLNNLVKMRRESAHQLVGQRWLPSAITMEHFQLRTQTDLTLRWTQDANLPPEPFQPELLSRPSGLAWPTPSPAATP
jgi:hypothetical protein